MAISSLIRSIEVLDSLFAVGSLDGYRCKGELKSSGARFPRCRCALGLRSI